MLDPDAVNQVIALLRRVPLFAGLPQADLAWVAAGLHQRAYPPGAMISREGERSRFFSVLLEGEIAVYKSLGLPEERLLDIMQAGDFFGEMSLYDEVPLATADDEASGNLRTASLVAHSLVVVLELPSETFKRLLHRQPGLAYRVMQVMASRLRQLESATIRDLREKNRRLSQALTDLQAAQAQLVEKEKLEVELVTARRIQQRILPKELPDLPGWEIQARWQPARSVSGDFYDFLALPDGRLGVVIGDVSGKGVPASLVMATTCSVLRATARTLSGRRLSPGRRRTGTTGFFQSPFKSGAGRAGDQPAVAPDATGIFAAPSRGVPFRSTAQANETSSSSGPAYLAAPLSPGQLLAHANDVLCRDMPPGMFAACLFGLLDPHSGEFRFANAGHCLPLLLRAAGGTAPAGGATPSRVQELRATGMPLGLLPEREYEETSVILAPGDRLLLYSDGLIEAHDPAGGMFGVPRLRQELAGLRGELIDGLLGCLEGFTGPGWEAEDDVTLVTLQRLPR